MTDSKTAPSSKPPSSIIGPQGEIRLPEISERVDFEGELGVVIQEVKA